jgi:hypothetical protein
MAKTRYLKPTSKEFDAITLEMEKTYPGNICVVDIKEVENETLENKYNAKKASLYSYEERRVLHGTTLMASYEIMNEGFDVGKNVRSALGKGTYFTTSTKYSSNFSKPRNHISVIILADILVKKDENENYTTGVDKRTNPSVFVVSENDEAIPRYIVYANLLQY